MRLFGIPKKDSVPGPFTDDPFQSSRRTLSAILLLGTPFLYVRVRVSPVTLAGVERVGCYAPGYTWQPVDAPAN